VNRVIFAGGGTAGHIEPALSVAREWKMTHVDSEIIFLGTEAGLETRLVPDAGFNLSFITKVRISRSLSPSLLSVPFTFILSVSQCIRLVRKADLVVGFGGYVSGPAYFAAALTGTPFVIHEANARPGIANRIGAYLTRFTAVTHPIENGSLASALMSGLPLREDVISAYHASQSNWSAARKAAKSALGFSDTEPLIFIFGGSQGSSAINAVIADSRESLTSQGIQILHGVGARNEVPASQGSYRAVNYISDMATAYLAADIVISRSGAVTCAEVNTLGKYALFIPLPIGNGEQELNARYLVAQSRAEVISQNSFTSEWLVSHIHELLQRSAQAPVEGSSVDIEAAPKMVALMEHALSGGK
jgi:UDP-N-acetylglucosamine--N-acetylmuramyl-(pentapeptide) pyrophosphoryl-undecaprenol N-acetylglucosamine transferase